MSESTVSSANRVQKWENDFFMEYVRESGFMPYMGTDENAVFQLVEDLTKMAGDRITVSLIRKLTGSGVSGATTLRGNEEALLNYGHLITLDWLRNGVLLKKNEEKKTELDLRNAARVALKNWEIDKMREAIITSLYSPALDNTAYASATEAQKDAWLTANSDRILFGALKSNSSSLDHSTGLGNVDNTNDKLTPSSLSLLKRMAKSPSNGAIRPIRVNNGEEWFVVFAGSLPFRDLKNNSTMQQANREAWLRGKDNPIFADGDLLWDGMIIREVPEIGVLTGVGNGGIDVAGVFLCGAQALGVAWGQRPKSYVQIDDYEFEHGVAIEEMRGIEKLYFNNIQHGVATHYVAAVADS